MKKVLILSASPRKNGNSDCLCQQFKKGAEEAGHSVEQIQAADVLVVATPTYFMTMNGMLKTTIDRFLPKWQDLGGHDVYLIVTGHDAKEGLSLVGEELTRVFSELGNTVKEIIWGERVWQKGEVLSTKAMAEAYRAGCLGMDV